LSHPGGNNYEFLQPMDVSLLFKIGFWLGTLCESCATFLYESRATFGGCYAVVIKFLSREDQTGTLFLSLNKEDVLVQSCRDPVENKSAKSIILLKEC